MQSLLVFVLLLGLSSVAFAQNNTVDGGDITVTPYTGMTTNYTVVDSPNDYDIPTATTYYPSRDPTVRTSSVNVSSDSYAAGETVIVYGYTGVNIQIQWQQIHTIQQIGVPCNPNTLVTPLAGGLNYSANCQPRNGPSSICYVNLTINSAGMYYFQDPAPGNPTSQVCTLFDVANVTPSPSMTSSISQSSTASISQSSTASISQSSTASISQSSSASISQSSTASISQSSSASISQSSSASISQSSSASISQSSSASISQSSSASISQSSSASISQSSSASISQSSTASISQSSTASISQSSTASISQSSTASISQSSTASISLSSSISNSATGSLSLSSSRSATASASPSRTAAPSPSRLPCRHPDATRSRALSWLAEVKCDHSVVNDTFYDTTPFIREYSVAQNLAGCQPTDSVFGDCSGTILFYHTCKPMVGRGSAECNRQRDHLVASVTFTCDLTIMPDYTCYPLTPENAACPSASNRPTHF